MLAEDTHEDVTAALARPDAGVGSPSADIDYHEAAEGGGSAIHHPPASSGLSTPARGSPRAATAATTAAGGDDSGALTGVIVDGRRGSLGFDTHDGSPGGEDWYQETEQEIWKKLIADRVAVQAARTRQKNFLRLGIAALIIGLVLAIVGVSLGWAKTSQFPAVVGGYCAILATLLSVLQVLEHLSAFSDPDIQSRTVRILAMVPIYALTSWMAILFQEHAVYFDLVRDMYESYALYTFFSLMLGYLGGLDECVRLFTISGFDGPGHAHPWPLNWCFCSRWYMLPTILYRITLSIMQFMFLKPLCTVVVVVLTACGEYGSSFTDWGNAFIYITIVYNISITFALYALVYFYVATKEMLRDYDPLLKFGCIKGVIFLSYWQSLIIAIMEAAGWLPRIPFWEEGEPTRTGLQDFLICCEMLIFAMVHKFVFPAENFTKGLQVGARVARGTVLPAAKQGIWTNLKITLRHSDVKNDFLATWSFIKTF